MTKDYDCLIIGSGPAGMAAARKSAELGLSVTLLDEQNNPGGQIYRNVGELSAHQLAVLGPDYRAGMNLVSDLDHTKIDHIKGATVWKVTPTGLVYYTQNQTAKQIKAKHILLATGALERACPIPGWTRPGVMTAGAAQILMKSGGLVADQSILIGSGPLLYLLAIQMVRAGRKPKAILETQSASNLKSALPLLPTTLAGWMLLAKGLGYLTRLRLARIPRYTAVSSVSLEGDTGEGGYDEAKLVRFDHKGREKTLSADHFFLHQGVVPNTQITRSLELEHEWSDQQLCFVPKTDAHGLTSEPIISLAGDGAGIGGADVAKLSGHIAAFEIAYRLDKITKAQRDRLTAPFFQKRAGLLSARPFLDAVYRPPLEWRQPADNTIICRCEEVTAKDIRSYAALGCKGPNQTKAFGRSGMGPCQGRFCGNVVTELLAEANNLTPQEVGSYRVRAPIKPVSIGELAALNESQVPDSA